MTDALHALVHDLAENGLRCDTNPTWPGIVPGNPAEIHRFYQDYLQRADRDIRARAKAALRKCS